MTFVDDHGERFSHGTSDAFDPTVAIGTIGVGSDLAHTCKCLRRATDSLEQIGGRCRTGLVGYPQRGIYLLTWVSAISAAVKAASETGYTSAHPQKRPVKRRM